MTKVWLVGTCDVEFTVTRYVCNTKEKALERWEELRLELIKGAKEGLEFCKMEGYSIGIYERIIDNLIATNDPEKMDNYPQERPFIYEMELDE
jgi:hypothetical protein